MRRLAAHLRRRRDDYARLITLEMGKPITEALAEIEKCALTCDFYADRAADFLRDEVVATNASRSLVAYQPLGVVLAIMPWNYPFWQVFRFAAPALMAGNGALLKHASNIPQCALAVGSAFEEAGFPHGLFRTLLLAGRGRRAGGARPPGAGRDAHRQLRGRRARRGHRRGVAQEDGARAGWIGPVHRPRRCRRGGGSGHRGPGPEPEHGPVVHRGETLPRRRVDRRRVRGALRASGRVAPGG